MPVLSAILSISILILQAYLVVRQQPNARGARVMIFAVLLEDNADRAAARAQHMPDHPSFLGRNSASIRAAGPLKDTAGETPAGGLWIVEADSPKAVQALIEADPLWPTGLRKSVRVLEWAQVFSDGKRKT